MKMYDPMYNVKFCKMGMMYAYESMRDTLRSEIQKLEDMRNENIFPQYSELRTYSALYKREWDIQRQEVKVRQISRAFCSINEGYERRRNAIAEARVAYENAINEAV